MRSTHVRVPAVRRATRASLALMLISVAWASHAADRVGGECTLDGNAIGFVDGVAYERAYTFDEDRQEIVVALAAFMLDKAAIAATESGMRDFEMFKQAPSGPASHRLELHILDGYVAELELDNSHTRMSPPPGPGVGTLRIDTGNTGRLSGEYSFAGDSDDDLRCSVTFDLAFERS